MSTVSGRVAFVYDHLYPESVGGAERYYWALSRALAAEQPVTQVAPRLWQGPSVRSAKGVEQVAVGGTRKVAFIVGVFWHLLRHGRRYRVVHCTGFPALAVLACRAGLLPHPAALVVDWHEVLPPSNWSGRRRFGRLFQRLAVRTGAVAVTFSRLHEQRLREEGRKGPVRVAGEFVPETPVLDGVAERERLIVFAGRLVADKRAHLIPAVLAELRAADAGWRAVVFGEGEELASVRARAVAEGVGDAIEFPGFVPWEEVSRTFRRAGALVLPSVREGFGLVVLEAAAHGLPVVLTAAPGNAAVELIEEGMNGHVCASADPGEQARAVLTLLQDPAIHSRTRDWYGSVAERYSVDGAVRELRALHAEISAA